MRLDYYFSNNLKQDRLPVQVSQPVKHSFLIRNAFTLEEIEDYYKDLNKLPWRVQEIEVAGKYYMPKRETLGFANASSNLLENRSFYGINYPENMIKIKDQVASIITENIIEIEQTPDMNYCWGNRYRTGEDKVGKHKDNEKWHSEIDPIISVSFGVHRHFDIYTEYGRLDRIELGCGDIFLMMPGFQNDYYHGVPVQKKIGSTRINLTFRTIHRPPTL